MIQGSLRASSHLSEEQLATTVVPMIKQLWDTLTGILKTRFNETVLITETCDLLRQEIDIVKNSKDMQVEQMFDSLSNNLLLCFQSNHHNSCCLKTMAHAIQLMGKESDKLLQMSMQQCAVYC